MSAAKKIVTVTCHMCRNPVNLRADGKIGEHRLFPMDGSPSTLCDGSGQRKPKDQ